MNSRIRIPGSDKNLAIARFSWKQLDSANLKNKENSSVDPEKGGAEDDALYLLPAKPHVAVPGEKLLSFAKWFVR